MKREKLMETLAKKYPTMFLRTSEEFNGNEGGIWTSGEESPRNAKGQELFDYWSESSNYSLGVRKDFGEYLEKLGWYCEWHDAGTIMIWEI
jgi:hypothetical protein